MNKQPIKNQKWLTNSSSRQFKAALVLLFAKTRRFELPLSKALGKRVSGNMRMEETSLKQKVERYRKVRKAVFELATEPLYQNETLHNENKIKLKNHILKICEEANLGLYRGTNKKTATVIWHHLWTKNRYAGIRSQIATKEILDIQDIFDDYEIFSSTSWDFNAEGHTLISAEKGVNDFLSRQGAFAGKQTIGNLPKLRKIVNIARKLKHYTEANKGRPILGFIENRCDEDDVWCIHKHLLNIGYTSDLTVLHFMMDLGYEVIKPDIVITKLFLTWGWLHEIIPELPIDLTIDDLQGKGANGSKYKYTHPRMYKPLIDLARQIVSEISIKELKSDIGWVTSNPLREFDIFVVKYGQQPEQECGIERTLFNQDAEIHSTSRSCATKSIQ